MNFRTITLDDVEAFWVLQDQLDSETKFVLYEAGERKKDLRPVEEMIRPSAEGCDFHEVAEVDGHLVGYLSAKRGHLVRTQHAVYVVSGMLKAFQGRGIAASFFKHLDSWALKN